MYDTEQGLIRSWDRACINSQAKPTERSKFRSPRWEWATGTAGFQNLVPFSFRHTSLHQRGQFLFFAVASSWRGSNAFMSYHVSNSMGMDEQKHGMVDTEMGGRFCNNKSS